MKTPASRLERITTQFFAGLEDKIAALQANGYDVIRLDVGSPDLPPAEHIIQALNQSASQPSHHSYQAHKGTPNLRQAWASMYQLLYAIDLNPENEILPLLGSKEGIFHILLALVQAGDIVLIPDPGYLTYFQGTLLAGGEPYYLPLLPENGYLPRLEEIPASIASRAKILWLNYPNNPTAAIAPLDFFARAVEFAHRFDVLLCHDAAYSQVTFDGYEAPSLLQIQGAKDVSIEFNTLSKSHNMAGWRAGAALGNAAALHYLHKLKTNADSGYFLPIMDAAAAAMIGDQSWLSERNMVYQQRRDVVMQRLSQLGLGAECPRASLYVWAAVPRGWRSLDFCAAVLDNAHVSLTPGTIFGAHGEGYFRISLTSPKEHLVEAFRRIKNSGLAVPRSAAQLSDSQGHKG